MLTTINSTMSTRVDAACYFIICMATHPRPRPRPLQIASYTIKWILSFNMGLSTYIRVCTYPSLPPRGSVDPFPCPGTHFIICVPGRNTSGTCFGETGLKIRPDVFRHDNCEQKRHVLLCKMSPASHFFLFEKGEKNNTVEHAA